MLTREDEERHMLREMVEARLRKASAMSQPDIIGAIGWHALHEDDASRHFNFVVVLWARRSRDRLSLKVSIERGGRRLIVDSPECREWTEWPPVDRDSDSRGDWTPLAWTRMPDKAVRQCSCGAVLFDEEEWGEMHVLRCGPCTQKWLEERR